MDLAQNLQLKRNKMDKLLCPYCGQVAVRVDSGEVYNGRSYGDIFKCPGSCDAYVGIHKNSGKPLGTLANAELRQWRMKAHAAFDPLWQRKWQKRREEQGASYKKVYARGSGYKWLRGMMGLTSKECHISMMNVEQCKQVVEICSNLKKEKVNV